MANREQNPKSEDIRHTNISIIDEGHNKLFDVHNHIKSLCKQGACKDDLAEIFFTLSYFFENHLIKEELYLKSKGYPNFDNHQTSHLSFIKEIESLKDNYENDVNSTLKELDVFIGNWLHDHSSNYNKEVVDFLNQKK